MNLVPLSWKELTKYNKKTNFKNRPIIIIELDDNMNKKYNAVIIKHDDKKNVHIRYLDNPFYEDKYWWTGNKNNISGLNPLCYHSIIFGDSYDEMDGLHKYDFQEDGYDDIINYDKESYRFFKSTSLYPYLDGIQGNVHVNNYYISEFNQCLSDNKVPHCIKNKTNLDDNIRRIKVPKDVDTLLYNILEGLLEDYSPIVEEYNINKNKKNKSVINNFKKILSLKMTYQFINRYHKYIGLNIDELLIIRDELRDGKIINNIIKILPYLLDYNIKIFECNNNDLDIIDYKSNSLEKYIYILKYLDRADTLR